MSTFNWWIDEPLVMGSGNPSDEDLSRFRAQGFSVALSLLEDHKQRPQYDRKSAEATGWSLYSIPIAEGRSPTLEQIHEFSDHLSTLPAGTKVVVFCESGLGRTACMGAAYWIMKGLTAGEAIERVRQTVADSEWITDERKQVLAKYAQLQRYAVGANGAGVK
jgi:protein-tyrosine phosphatase